MVHITLSVREAETSKERACLRVRRSLLVLGVIGFLFIVIFPILGRYPISGNGMKNTLSDGQSILVNKMAYRFHDPQRGDVILFNDPGTPGRYSVARVIGLPGDTISLETNDIWFNGMKLDESYLTNETDPFTDGFDQPVKVPSGTYFMLGDNRPT